MEWRLARGVASGYLLRKRHHAVLARARRVAGWLPPAFRAPRGLALRFAHARAVRPGEVLAGKVRRKWP
eukprot:1013841-Alexandrium_andersonii.AAC.1